MGQSQRPSAETVDLVITNAVIIDYWGIVKADVGIKNGRIFAVGKAGNPDTQSGVDIIIGPGTEVLSRRRSYSYRRWHRRPYPFYLPQQIDEALMSGVTPCSAVAPDQPLEPTQQPAPGAVEYSSDARGGGYITHEYWFDGQGNASQPQPLMSRLPPGHGTKIA